MTQAAMTQAKPPKKVDQLLTDLREARAAADTVMEEVPTKLRPGRQMAKNQALEALPGLIKAVESGTVPTRLVGVFASGDPAVIAKVIEFLSANGGIVLDAGTMYRQLGEYVEPAFGGAAQRSFNTVCFTRMISALREQAQLFGYRMDRNPEYEETVTTTLEEVSEHCRRLVRDAYGDAPNLAVLTRAIIDAVVKGNLSNKRIPVLIVNASEDEQDTLSQLFTRATAFEFSPEFEVTEESVVSTFKGR